MKKVFILTVICLFLGCSSEHKRPKDLLSQEQMISFQLELHIIESGIRNLRVSTDSTKTIFKYYESQLYDKYGFDEERYFNSYKYYLNHPDEMSRIKAAIVDSLSLKERLSE